MKRVLLCVLALTLALAVQVNAAVVRIDPPAQSIVGVTGFQTFGDEMVGMAVTANFITGFSDKVYWAATGPQAGAATGTYLGGWSLSLTGDTFSAPWNLANNTGVKMTSLVIDPFPGNTVFDTILDPALTPFSERGAAVFDDPLTGTFTGIVGIGLNAPLGDLYRFLEVTFGTGGLACDGSTSWRADTDTIGLPHAPIPGSLLLLGSGLLGLVGWRIRRN